MPISEDFSDAAGRIWRDASILFGGGRLATADHLFGVCAECALKAIMVTLSGHAKLPKRYWVHMPKIWDEFIAYSPQTGMHPYAVRLSPNPFQSWDVGDRYGAANRFAKSRVSSHCNGAQEAMLILEQARLDGLL